MNSKIDKRSTPKFASLLLESHRRLTGRNLMGTSLSLAEAALALYEAPFAVLAHDTGTEPRFIYANLTAQRLFEMSWEEIVGMPSCHSAEPVQRESRQRLLDAVARDGYIDDYEGTRIAKSGKRFRIQEATVWNLTDDEGRLHGQAAAFAHWRPLDD